ASPELRQAALLLRLQRAGIATARLLAFGQRQVGPWRMESLLLTESDGSVSLDQWLREAAANSPDKWTMRARRRVIQKAASVLRRLHELHYYLTPVAHNSLRVTVGTGQKVTVLLGSLQNIVSRRRASAKLVQRDLIGLRRHLGRSRASQTDLLRF